MSTREHWDWDEEESDGYNYICALEVTFINFGLMTEDEITSGDQCRAFNRKWSANNLRNIAREMSDLKKTVAMLQDIIDEQVAEIHIFKEEISKANDSIWSDVREVRSELSQDINQVEGCIDALSDSVSSSLDDFGSEIADIRHDLDKNINEVNDITSNLADRVLLD